MATEIKVPTVGESISEVVIGQWLVAEGAALALDEAVVGLETDKVNVDVPAPSAGVLLRILKKKGEIAKVGEVIGLIDSAGATVPAGQAVAVHAAVAVAGEVSVMPAAQRILGQAGIDPATVEGTGPRGKVMKHDAQAAALKLSEGVKIPLVYADPAAMAAQGQAHTPVQAQAQSQAQSQAQGQAQAPMPSAPKADAATVGDGKAKRQETLVPMTPLRKRVAQRLVEAQANAAILTTFNECDMSAVMDLRKKYQEAFTGRHGIKLGFMAFFVRACVDALKAFPLVNAQIRGTDIVMQSFYDIGVAVGGGKGLVVPIVRDADQLSLADIERKLADFGARAKASTLKLEELQGGTFSISNGGVYGSMMSTPILNPPQSAILGMHNIIERPIGVNGQVVLRPMMYLALSYDHRLIDGREAVQFLVRVKNAIEAPERLLLDV